MSRRALLALIAPAVAVGLVFYAAKRNRNGSPITPGPDTTVITGPLDAGGLIDYETALNERLRGTCTPDTNAVVGLLACVGPKPEGTELHRDVYRWLGCAPPPAEGEYLTRYGEVFRDELRGVSSHTFIAREGALRDRPWVPEQDAQFADWIAANEKPLAVAVDACRRPHYFHPLVARAGEDGRRKSLYAALLPLPQRLRDLANILSLRVMLRCGQKRYADAWQDVLTVHRLARLVSRGGTFIELLVALAIENSARNAALRFLDATAPDAKQALACRDDLAALPPMAEAAEKLETERYYFIDVCQFFRQDGAEMLKLLGLNPSSNEGAGLTEGDLRRVDWNRTLRYGNGIFDQYAAALRLAPRERVAAVAAVEAELKELQQYREGLDAGRRILLLLLPALDRMAAIADRHQALRHTEVLAFALAAHKADTGKYPFALKDLLPRYATGLPEDMFSGKGFQYVMTNKGYLLYSVGPNGIDDGGRSVEDDPRGDDLGVRVPNVKMLPPDPFGGAGE